MSKFIVRNCGIFQILRLRLVFKTLVFLFLLFICSCKNRTDIGKSQQNAPIPWHYLALELNDTIIKLHHIEDTLEIVKLNSGVQKHRINENEKDSLFAFSNALIDFKGQPEWSCTDYVSKLKVRIRYNEQLLKEVSFSSLCDWRELNDTTIRIDQLLKKIIQSQSAKIE